MFTTVSNHRTRRLHGVGVALAGALLFAGCTSSSAGDDPPGPSAAEEVTGTTTVTWEDVWDEAFGDDGENVEEIDGVAEDFPAEIPLPEGDLVFSVAGDGVWDMIFETENAEAEAERIVASIGEIVAAEADGTTPDDGEYWVFLDERYMIQVQMQPGPTPPAMVGITVVER
ncbi:hypothetical protein GCM10022200_07240 [Microbacterium awajiense]|uniref:Lipoprotein n=1 Tax=Microbacterium awajiense TaxID=415214 RepID=A0ABP7A9N3_9MICO